MYPNAILILWRSHCCYADPKKITLVLFWSYDNHTGAILILWQSHWWYSNPKMITLMLFWYYDNHTDAILILGLSHWCYSDPMTVTLMLFWSYDDQTDASLILWRSFVGPDRPDRPGEGWRASDCPTTADHLGQLNQVGRRPFFYFQEPTIIH